MSTHINSANVGDIAESVLLPGDPLRAKYIAENFLENARCYSEVRNMFGFTGTYKGVPVSVQGTGMGMPFMGIYSVFSVYYSSCERPLPSQIISLLRGILLVVPLALVFYLLGSADGIWLTVPIAELLTTVTAFSVYTVTVKPYELCLYPYQMTRSRR